MRTVILLTALLLLPLSGQAVTACPTDTVAPDGLPATLHAGVSVVVAPAARPGTASADTPATPDSVAAAISERLAALLDNDIFARTQIGLYVYDLTADRPVFAHGERQQLRPASNQKLVTAIAALTCLGTDYLYRTRLCATGQTDADSVLHGDLYVRGGFDPLFAHDDLRAFTEAIRAAGIRSVEGSLLFDRTLKDTAALGWGWCWDDRETPLSPLLFDARPGLERHLVKALAEAGIAIGGGTGYAPLPDGATLLCERTRTIDQILLPMMKRSDNLFAESLFYQLAAHSRRSYAGRRQAAGYVNDLIASLGLSPSAYQIADGSGLSLYNYLSPELLVALLRHAYRHRHIYDHLLPSLPVAGIDGTLRRRMKSGTACGNVCAKTGTVEGVSTLSGYCTAPDGHTYCFSIMNQGIRHTSTGRNFQDRVCQALTQPLGRPEPAEASPADTLPADGEETDGRGEKTTDSGGTLPSGDNDD